MTRYLLDTNHVSAVFKREAAILQRMGAATGAEFCIGTPALGELWYMVFNSARIAQNTRDLSKILADFKLLEFDPTAAMEFGRFKGDLRRAGRPIPDVDIQIAAIALVNGLTLLTRDAHFGYLSGIKIEDWTAVDGE